jgi:ABC-type Fe3+-hydroxamate transport system substrate-binding protein
MKFIDQMNNTILLSETPKRIVSLVPSITELLVDLGLEENIVGITKFCEEPNYLKNKIEIIGGTKNININKIKNLNPDLIIANKEENLEKQIIELKKYSNVWVSNIKNLEENLDLILKLGEIFNKKSESESLIKKTKLAIKTLSNIKIKNNKSLYLIWKNPYMSVGIDTYIHDIITKIGLKNCILMNRYPLVELSNFKNVDYILLSSEPYPFKKKDIYQIRNELTDPKIILVDGKFFSWYGSRFSKSLDYLEEFISKLD